MEEFAEMSGGCLTRIFPEDDDETSTTVDIVAIHGFEPTSPWEATGGDKNEQVVRQVNWLSELDMLPSVTPSARIYTFSWNANYYANIPIIRVLDLAEVLLDKLQDKQEKDGNTIRPLVFIASCFGGLIVTKALELANFRGSLHRKILLATTGVTFLASPLPKSLANTTFSWRMMLEELFDQDPSPTLIEDLDAHIKPLRETSNNFAAMLSKPPLQQMMTTCFWEMQGSQSFDTDRTRETASLFNHGPISVERVSEYLQEDDARPYDVGPFTMCGLQGPADPNYILVSTAIQKMVDRAHGIANFQLQTYSNPTNDRR